MICPERGLVTRIPSHHGNFSWALIVNQHHSDVSVVYGAVRESIERSALTESKRYFLLSLGCVAGVLGYDIRVDENGEAEGNYTVLGFANATDEHLSPIGRFSLSENASLPVRSTCHSVIPRRNPPIFPPDISNPWSPFLWLLLRVSASSRPPRLPASFHKSSFFAMCFVFMIAALFLILRSSAHPPGLSNFTVVTCCLLLVFFAAPRTLLNTPRP